MRKTIVSSPLSEVQLNGCLKNGADRWVQVFVRDNVYNNNMVSDPQMPQAQKHPLRYDMHKYSVDAWP